MMFRGFRHQVTTIPVFTLAVGLAATPAAAAGPDPLQAVAAADRLAQFIYFPQPQDITDGYQVSVSATSYRTANPGWTTFLTVSLLSETPDVCQVQGDYYYRYATPISEGTCTITATQSGDANFLPAAPVTRSFNVKGGSQTITFPKLSDTALGDSPSRLEATVGYNDGDSITYASTTPAVCLVDGSTAVIVGAGICSISASAPQRVFLERLYGPAAPVERSFRVYDPNALPTRVTALSMDTGNISCWNAIRMRWSFSGETTSEWLNPDYAWQARVQHPSGKAKKVYVLRSKPTYPWTFAGCLHQGNDQFLWGDMRIRLRGKAPDGTTTRWSSAHVYREFDHPSKPQKVRLSRGGPGLIATWDAPKYTYGADVTKSAISVQARYPLGMPRPTLNGTCPRNTHTCTYTASQGYKYRVRVKVSNGHGWSGWSNSQWVRY